MDGWGDRVRRRLLGRPLLASEITGERLAKPTALAVFSSDCISSSAYATEEILRVLIPAAGIAGFALLVPITTAMVVVLFFLVLSYRQTITAYPTAGGAYMVTRDNFGLIPAQVAGVSLLTDYVLTVAVSVAAGTDAISSAAPSLAAYHVVIAASFIVLIAYGNLRGVKDAGRVFAVPTYAFITMMALILGLAALKETGVVGGHLAVQHVTRLHGAVPIGHGAEGALFYGATLYVILHAFASGGAALTGVEAISNGVSAFRTPQARNARTTLVIMGVVLGTIFLGVSAIAAKVHAIPYVSGAPTVISQVGKAAFGRGSVASVLFYALQISTTAVLVLAANTSFADFPRLANFHAHDDFMPRQLTVKGYRLVFSNGIIALATAALVLLLLTGASVDRLIPLYAIGVFTSFTLSQAGMAKHHLTRREEGWRYGLAVNSIGAVLSGVVDVVILITKFTHGAWIILVVVPTLVVLLVRLNKEYRAEDERLHVDITQISSQIGLDDWVATASSSLRPGEHRRVVLVPVGRLDASIVAALRHALRLGAQDIIAVHASIEPDAAKELAHQWPRAGLDRLPLEVVEAPGRRVGPPFESVARAWAGRGVDVEVVLPLRVYRSSGWPLVHHRNARKILQEVVGIPGVIVTTVPFLVGTPRQPHTRPHTDVTGPPMRTNDRVTLDGVVTAVEWSPDSRRARRGTVRALIDTDRGTVLAEWCGRRRPQEGEPLPEALVRIDGIVRPGEQPGGPPVLVNPRLTIIRPAAPEEEAQPSPH